MSAFVRRNLDRELLATIVGFIATISLAAAIGVSAVGTNLTVLTASTELSFKS
ncbi:MAG: hypothetical protein KF889_00845 [Alphaproteobacteria bacterium]|nr:hypothetical protein [Alphaproteobacteria bacterium]MCW5741450.1 hypothetical protein [Alphaproteobacteria bacterium]